MTAKIQTGGFYQKRWKIWEKIRYDALDDNERGEFWELAAVRVKIDVLWNFQPQTF